MHYFLLFLALFSIQSMASDTYSVKEYIGYLTDQHVASKQLKSKQHASQHHFGMANAITDWNIQTTVYGNHAEPYQTSSFSPSTIDTFGTEFSLFRPILTTGGQLGFNINNTKVSQSEISFNDAVISPGQYYNNAISVTYTQPLLYGFMGEALNYPIMVASTNVKVTTLQTDEQFEHFIASELSTYIDWVLLNEVTELMFSRLQLARASFKQTKNRVRVNLSEKIDLLRAEFSVQQAHQMWLTQKARLKSLQFKMATRMDNPGIISKTPTFDLYSTAYVKKPDYVVVGTLRAIKSRQLHTKPLEAQLNLAKSKRNGTLNLKGSYDFIGGDTDFQGGLSYLNNNTGMSINYSRPLTDTYSTEAVKQRQRALDDHTRQQQQIEIDLKSDIVALYTLLEEQKQILSVTLKQIVIAQDKAKAEDALYKQGRSSIDLVIQAQDNVLDTKVAYTNASANYQKYVLFYQDLIDNLLGEYSIKL
jgi:outer membrane protein TolC